MSGLIDSPPNQTLSRSTVDSFSENGEISFADPRSQCLNHV